MIFFGTRGKVVPGPVIRDVRCQYCGQYDFNTYGVLRYFHLYWIPTFPFSRKVGIECAHCKSSLLGNDVPADLRKRLKPEVFSFRNTWSSFLGLILIAMLALFIALTVIRNNARGDEYLASPAAGDLYLVDLTRFYDDLEDKEYRYGVMRVNAIDDGQVALQVGRYGFTKRSGVRDAIREGKTDDDAYYVEELLYTGIDQLPLLHAAGAIVSVQRK